MIGDKIRRVGCAIATYTNIRNGTPYNIFLFACNYSYGNVYDDPVYITGTTASGCQTGTNSKYPGLCSIYEVVSSSPYI